MLLLFLKPFYGARADRWQTETAPVAPKRKRKKVYQVKKEEKTVQAVPVDADLHRLEFLHRARMKLKRMREEEDNFLIKILLGLFD